MSKWLLIDNLEPNRPCLVNMDTVHAINWDKGTMTLEFDDARVIEVECEKQVFIGIASKLDIMEEIE